VGSPGAERPVPLPWSTSGVHRRADLRENRLRPSGCADQSWRDFPIHPADIMLLGGEQQRFCQTFVPVPSNCPEIQACMGWLNWRAEGERVGPRNSNSGNSSLLPQRIRKGAASNVGGSHEVR